MKIPILFEDEDLLVINKPPGIVVNRAQSVKEETIEDWAGKKLTSQVERSGIVHRIDKETSGCLLIAKTPHVFFELQRQFKEREIHKTYLAIVHGSLVPEEGEIRAPVGRLPWNRERFGIVPGGREAMTKYKVRKSDDNYSFVELYPQTGRTHQIRVHLKYINHPIVGDYLYAGRKTSRADRQVVGRVMLHAWKISFTHPSTKKLVTVEAPIPDDMMKVA
ncbi:MAG: Pseudouridine synthase [uncultured bacterium]|uniref:Pseudouridine synthase n=1 Tax=Candidatus Gottesmanbacteria bacterium RIFCSPLOWO2_01_FULL_43_11b TaxID=1798392 RepID=A0A1F6AGH9_9BACT|nr:MAG: Pseudouridine synthase [uncultured bacterium]OGG23706.1 MAG: hypothetical protein A3A79_00665 [Candidatus Gottesmanbacteria bacterium RIFCSPLOWO2_01_FULL_43_11b]